VEALKYGYGGPHLIGLERAEKMPFCVGRKVGRLGDGFLDPILPEAAETCAVSGQEVIHRLHLARTHQ
jgi:hypothetical protein